MDIKIQYKSLNIDIVESDDPEQVEKAAMIIRAYGHSTTETMVATPWKEFLKMLQLRRVPVFRLMQYMKTRAQVKY